VSDELDRLITQWAARHAPELIAQAQADALELARERLRARLVDALLAAAEARLTERPPQPQPQPKPKPREAGERLVWVYGVVRDDAEPAPREGVDGHPVRLHRHGDVTALVSDVPGDRFGEQALKARLEDLDALEALARGHESVLQAALASGAVVPFRLCTIYTSPERLDAMLERERASLTATLERLDRMHEWGVKAFLRTPAAGAAAEPAATGTEYLSRKRERREADEVGRGESESLVAGIHARLTEVAAAAVLSRPHDRKLSGREAEMVLNGAYLVPGDGADGFRAVVEALGRRHEPDGIELELTGPWPPHHFVETPEP
jgi:Gas vesicle synthesis protein GvpL/GvpF